MKIVIENYKKIKDNIEKKYPDKSPNIIAVSKTFPIEHIQPLINLGHLHYGENKVQEAMSKWTEIKKINRFLKLHMIGKLQSNKAKDAYKLFDFIHSLDNEKLALKLSNLERDQEKKIKYFIQVNLGNESQKSGISKSELKNFYEYSKRIIFRCDRFNVYSSTRSKCRRLFFSFKRIKFIFRAQRFKYGHDLRLHSST